MTGEHGGQGIGTEWLLAMEVVCYEWGEGNLSDAA